MKPDALEAWVAASAEELEVPGVAVGVLMGGEEHYAFHGVTSVDNPLPVDRRTLFQFGSTGKTFTATAMMRLVEQGEVDLDAPVRRYLPEFELKDESAAASVTVLQLFNHTAGWEGDFDPDTGEGDDSVARYVGEMSTIEQVTPPGELVSYNNASLVVAGRIIEKLSGTTYEAAIKDLVLDPVGLENTWVLVNDVMTRRFAVGHTKRLDGSVVVARPWAMHRGGNPAGGISSDAADQIRWARFHLGDGTGVDGTRALSDESLDRMKVPTVQMRGSAFGDAVGISWLIREVEGVTVVGHGGSTIGQYSAFEMVPEANFALVSLTNCGPNGPQFNDALIKWAFGACLGIDVKDPEPITLSADDLSPYEGVYETIDAIHTVAARPGDLEARSEFKDEAVAQIVADGGEPPEDDPPFGLGMLEGDGDRYVVGDGPAKGMLGYFLRDRTGTVSGLHIGGRLATRTTQA